MLKVESPFCYLLNGNCNWKPTSVKYHSSYKFASAGHSVTGAGRSLIRSVIGFGMDVTLCNKEVATTGLAVVLILAPILDHNILSECSLIHTAESCSYSEQH